MDELYLNSIELEQHPNPMIQHMARISSDVFETHPQLQTISQWKNQVRSPVEAFYEREMRLGNHRLSEEPPTTERLVIQTSNPLSIDIEVEPVTENNEAEPMVQHLPQHVLLLGGSSMKTAFGSVLEQHLQDRNLQTIREAQIGTGLSRADVIDWSARLSDLLHKHPSIDLVIVQFIGNDCQTIVDSNHQIIAKYGTPEWNTAYINKWDALYEATQEANADLMIIGLPIMKNKRFDQRIQTVTDLVMKWATDHQVDFLPIRNYTINTTGEYTQYLELDGRNRKIRLTDGVHLSFVGSTIVATEVFNTLNQKYDWPLVSTEYKYKP